MPSLLRPVVLSLGLMAVHCAAIAQSPDMLATDKKIIDFAKENSQVMDNLEYLCDQIGPRLTGSPRLKKANDWTADKMKEYGLDNVHLESYTIPVAWERVKCEARVLEPNGMDIMVFAQPWTPGTRGKVTGPVVFFNALTSDDYAKFAGKLKNAIILTARPGNVQEHPSRTKAGDFWSRRGLGGTVETEETVQQRQQLSKRDEFLKKEGVAAIIQEGFGPTPQTLIAITGGWSRTGAQPVFPRVYTNHENYSMLYRLTQRNVPIKMEINVQNRWIKGPVTVYNTVGEIKGSEKPDEMVVCGAHLDSWDLGQGAVDNGTGSMVVLETARLIKAMGLQPKRTIRFVLFSGEEQGLYGSRAYVTQHKDEMGKITAVFVNDTGTGRVTGFGLHGNPQVQPVLDKELGVLKELGVEKYRVPQMGGTDHASFYASGVPAFWFMQDNADYDLMHHTQSDTFDKAIKEDLVQCATVMVISALNVANLPDMLPRRPMPAAAPGTGSRP
jgi:carboxypeptidase Q